MANTIGEHAAGLVRMYHDFDRDINDVRERLDQWYVEEPLGDEATTGTYTIPEEQSIEPEEAAPQKTVTKDAPVADPSGDHQGAFPEGAATRAIPKSSLPTKSTTYRQEQAPPLPSIGDPCGGPHAAPPAGVSGKKNPPRSTASSSHCLASL